MTGTVMVIWLWDRTNISHERCIELWPWPWDCIFALYRTFMIYSSGIYTSSYFVYTVTSINNRISDLMRGGIYIYGEMKDRSKRFL